jgi:hypothetical protein
VGLANTRISTDGFAQKLPDHCLSLLIVVQPLASSFLSRFFFAEIKPKAAS